jgi:hypothetical protein
VAAAFIDSRLPSSDNPTMPGMKITLIALVCCFGHALAEHAPSLVPLYSFQGSPNDGSNPGAVVFGSGGILFGVTLQGGVIVSGNPSCPTGCGTVFQLQPPPQVGGVWTETVLYAFTGSGGDGAAPVGVAIGGDGTLYGATSYGGNTGGVCGDYGCGTVFQLTPPESGNGAWTETILHSFTGQNGDGAEPFAGPVIGGSGALWGTTYGGGAGGGSVCGSYCGTVYEVAKSSDGSWKERTIHSFSGQDGASPYAGLAIGSGGALYGTTWTDGAGGWGTVFEMKPPQGGGADWSETVLYSFLGDYYTHAPDGASPEGALAIGSNGVLYGTTVSGGTWLGCGDFACGTAFELAPPTVPGGVWSEKLIHDFGDTWDGDWPRAGVAIGASGVLYGTTSAGGQDFGGAGEPVVYELAPPEAAGKPWRYGVLHGGGGSGAGVLIGTDGLLYGTLGGGTYNFGMVFQLTP